MTVILEGLMRIRNKAEYTGIMFNLVPREFTIPDLLKVFEVLSGKEVHPKVFREKIAGQLVSLDRSQRPIVGRNRLLCTDMLTLTWMNVNWLKCRRNIKTV